MSQPVEDKDKKIADLRSLLTQAKTKIEEYKAQLHLKEKETQQVKKAYEKKIKSFEAQSENIIKQYEQRLLRYQKTLQESNQLIDKHQKGMQYASKGYQQLLKKIGSIYSITNKTFSVAASKEKENTDAVQELYQLQKCNEFLQNLEKFNQISDLDIISKMLSLVVKNTKLNLDKRRQQRIQFVKKQTILQKNIEDEKIRVSKVQLEVDFLKKQLSETREKYERIIQSMNKNRLKMQEEKTNEQFIKQLIIKLIMGPKDASIMAFGILSKVLKMSEDEIKKCEKKIK